MKVVFLKKNDYKKYNKHNLDGYKFNPRNKNIKSLIIIKDDFIKYVLSKKIRREINKLKKTIKLIVNSDVAINSDCDMMFDEIIKLSLKLEKKYMKYFDEFEYFESVKELYLLTNVIHYKKRVLCDEKDNNI